MTRRVLTNGSIYIDMAHLTNGQQLLLSLDDAPTDLVVADGYKAGLAGTFSPRQHGRRRRARGAVAVRGAQRRQPIAPRTIRYIEDRRAEERRFTGAIESHPSPLAVVWGADDPIAVLADDRRVASAPAPARPSPCSTASATTP